MSYDVPPLSAHCYMEVAERPFVQLCYGPNLFLDQLNEEWTILGRLLIGRLKRRMRNDCHGSEPAIRSGDAVQLPMAIGPASNRARDHL